MTVCRTCMNPETSMVSMFIYKIEDQFLKDILILFTSIEIQDDTLPETICKQCVDLLEMFYKFKKTSENCQKELRSALAEKQLMNSFTCSPEINIESIDSNDSNTKIENCDHSPIIEVINIEPPVKKKSTVQCDLCGKTFTKNAHLVHHLKIHNDERNYKCADCNKTFVKQSHLSYHQRIHNGFKPHICKICNKKFAKSSNLTVHLLIHENVKRFLCTICNKKFSQKVHLISHLKLHTGIRPYICHCGASYTREHDLKKHEKTHNGIKDFLCNFCGSLFTIRNDLNRHLAMHSENKKNYVCTICFNKFTRLSSLNRHKKKVHK